MDYRVLDVANNSEQTLKRFGSNSPFSVTLTSQISQTTWGPRYIVLDDFFPSIQPLLLPPHPPIEASRGNSIYPTTKGQTYYSNSDISQLFWSWSQTLQETIWCTGFVQDISLPKPLPVLLVHVWILPSDLVISLVAAWVSRAMPGITYVGKEGYCQPLVQGSWLSRSGTA